MEHLSLKELNSLIKDTLSTQMDPSYWIVAEIGELRLNQSGHCYLEFVEKNEDSQRVEAKIRGTIWSYAYRTISAWFESITGEQLRSGITVLANVQVSFHEVYGLSLNVKDIDPNFTLGERARKRQEVIQRLQDEGVFQMNKQLELPLVPQRIAVISAESAAGYGDFINQIKHNPYAYKPNLKLFQAVMQGDKATESIISALMAIHQNIEQFDAVVIIRGGGAQIDLDCFDEYELCVHVAQFPIPIFAGIGHERDESVCDLVANTSLKTPTAVAEFIVRGFMNFEESISLTQQKLLKNAQKSIVSENSRLEAVLYNLRYAVQKNQNRAQQVLERNINALKNATHNFLLKENSKISLNENTLKHIDPKSIFKRGYSYSSVNGKSIQSEKVKEGDELITVSEKQKIRSIVQNADSNQSK